METNFIKEIVLKQTRQEKRMNTYFTLKPALGLYVPM